MGLLSLPQVAWSEVASPHLTVASPLCHCLSSYSRPNWASSNGRNIPKEKEQKLQGLRIAVHFCHNLLVKANYRVIPDSSSGEINPPIDGRNCKEFVAIFNLPQTVVFWKREDFASLPALDSQKKKGWDADRKGANETRTHFFFFNMTSLNF